MEDYLSYELGKAVQELPPLYTRLLAGSITLIVFGSLAWAHFSQVDEVAVASGVLIPSAEVQPIRSLSGGMIRNVHVKEGQLVEKGDVLMERDTTMEQAEVDRIRRAAGLIRQDIARLEAEQDGKALAGSLVQKQLLDAHVKEFEARNLSVQAEVQRQRAGTKEAEAQLDFLVKSLTTEMARTKEKPSAFTNLDEKQAEAKSKIASIEKEIATQKQKIRQSQEAYQVALNASERLETEHQSEILTQLSKRREELSNIEGQLKQSSKQQEQQTIKAPVAGTVYHVKAATDGATAQPGEELLSILPRDQELILEVKVLNKDVGFVSRGMQAKIKLATFPFQEFGTVDGTLLAVSPNAIPDEKLGLVFPARIKLQKDSMRVRGKQVSLTPGMIANGEIVTRQKSVLTFLIEPITSRYSEAFSVR
jgi:HlyD family secretion protein